MAEIPPQPEEADVDEPGEGEGAEDAQAARKQRDLTIVVGLCMIQRSAPGNRAVPRQQSRTSRC